MKINLKRLKLEKTQICLKSSAFLLVSVHCTKMLKLNILDYGLKTFFVNSKIGLFTFKKSVFKNFKFIFSSSIFFFKIKPGVLNNIKTLNNLNVVGIKLNNKIYSRKQLWAVSYLQYTKNLKVFGKLLTNSVLKTYLKLISK